MLAGAWHRHPAFRTGWKALFVANAQPFLIHRHHCPTRQGMPMAFENVINVVCPLTRWNPYQTEDARVRMPIDNRQFAKILIQGYEDAVLLVSDTQDFPIAGIAFPGTGPNHIMPQSAQ